ncbi:amidohydrolase [Microseira wollei]|nr:amidohydrolase [Microseira wollei]
MEDSQPTAEAVAVLGDTILAVGSLKEVQQALHNLGYHHVKKDEIDRTFENKVILPGFVEHHIHPLLGAMTMAVEIIAIEDWTVPGKESKAAQDETEYKNRLKAALVKMRDSGSPENETLFTWGYHHYFHGICYRDALDQICEEVGQQNRPVVIWHRSCHEFIFNTVALNKYNIHQDWIDTGDPQEQNQADLANGHFWEKGMELILSNIALDLLSENRVKAGLDIFRKYLLSKGITTICEPGTQMDEEIHEQIWNPGLNTEDTAFRTYFIPDGRVLYDEHKNSNSVGKLIEDTESWLDKGTGKVDWLPNQVKLFADGAIFSQLMQLQDPYLDGHQGEWIAKPKDYKAAFKIYWEAGYQIHTHVNGDEGLRVVIETLSNNIKSCDRPDHRFTVVHFAVSTEEQVQELKELGAIVSANPYYVTALADKYSHKGLGPERALNMVRLGSVANEGMKIGLHSDMPMAPADPLFLAWCAATRILAEKIDKSLKPIVAAPEQCISVERALSGITIESAYFIQKEDEVGSIKPNKKANFAILEEDPLAVPKQQLKDIAVWGCVFEGQKFPAHQQPETLPIEVSKFDLKHVNLAAMARTRG